MSRALIRSLSCLVALAALLGGTAVSLTAQDDLPKSKKKTPPTDPDDDVIVPKSKTKTKTPPKDDDDDVIVPKSKSTGGAGARSLQSLLKQANLKYETQENDDGRVLYKIPVTVKGQKSNLVAFEVTMGQANDGQEVKAAVIACQVASFPSDYRPTVQLYKVITDFNDKFVFGKGLVGTGGVNYACPFWLRTADVTTLLDQLYLAHTGRLELKKRVQAVFEEEE